MTTKKAWFCFFYGFLALVQMAISIPIQGEVRAEEVKRGANDPRGYRHITLANSLRVLLISDPEADKSAASLDVYVGSGADPVDRPGLAHFLEHMLFLGTEKYPQAGEYQTFITAHGGQHNAYTSNEHTNYFFDIENRAFSEALDRFGQFFITPLFSAQYVQREKHAVHSEYQASTKSDPWRIREALQHAFNSAHPASKFSVGTLQTLEDREDSSIREALIRFYRKFYSANLMALTVLSPAHLDEQERLVRSIFSPVVNRRVKLPSVEAPLFAPGRLPMRMDVIPVKDTRRLTLAFPIPELFSHYRTKPTGYLANLIGHEGEGSLLSLLIAKGWADNLSAGTGHRARDSATFDISIQLTREGLASIDRVGQTVFSYLRLLRRSGPDQWRFAEQARIAEIDYRFKEFSTPLHYVSNLSRLQHLFPIEDILYGPYRMDRFEPPLISRFLDYLRPDNVLAMVVAKGLAVDKKTRYFSTQYRLTPLNEQVLAAWKAPDEEPELYLPSPNVFIPEDIGLKVIEAQAGPEQIVDKPGYSVWYQPDQSFRVPRSSYYISVRSPVASSSAKDIVLLKLLVNAVNESLKEYAYPVQLAGLNYELYPHVRGLTIRISGYDSKQPELLRRIIANLRSLTLETERFADLKETLERELDNQSRERPPSQISRRLMNLLLTPRWTAAEQRQALVSIEIKEVYFFVERFFQEVEIVSLAHGNLTQDDVGTLSAIVERSLSTPGRVVTVPRGRLARLSADDQFVIGTDVDHDDSTTMVYYQGRSRSFQEHAHFDLLQQIISAPFYKQLRTEEQLGYVVYAAPMPILEVPGIAFVIQSPRGSSAYLRHRMMVFLQEFDGVLQQFDETRFETHRQGLLSRVLEKDKNLKARSQRYWYEIYRKRFTFDTQQKLAQAIGQVTLKTLNAFYQEQILGDGQRRIVNVAPGDDFRFNGILLRGKERFLSARAKLWALRGTFPEIGPE